MKKAKDQKHRRANTPPELDAQALAGLYEALHEFASLVVLDPDWNITYANELFTERFDAGGERLVGRNCKDFNCETANGVAWSQVQAKIASGETWQGEVCLHPNDEQSVWLRALIHPVQSEDGSVYQIIALLRDISREKGIEIEFKQSRMLNEEAARVARLGAWEYDLVKNTIYWSTGTKNIHEVAEDYVPNIESSIHFYKPGDSRERIASQVKAAIEKGQPFDDEFEIITAKGKPRWVRSIGHAEHVDGKCVRIFGVFQDIDREKRLRLNYESTSSFLHNVLDAATEFSIIATDKTGLISLFNAGAEKLLGYRKDEMVGKSTPEKIHLASEVEARGAKLSEKYGRKIEGFEVFVTAADKQGYESREWTYVRKDGSHVPVILVVTPQTDSHGEIIGYIGIARDISLRKQALEELRISEERWHFALEGSGDGVWDWDAQTNKVFYSHTWKAMLGYADDEIGDSLEEWKDRVHPDDLEQTLKDLEAHFSGQKSVYSSEHRMRCKDGSYKWILDRGKVIERSEDGKPLRVIGTHSDVTERRIFQQRIEESEHRFRSAFADSAIGMAVVGLEGQWIEVNPSLCQIFGYTEANLRQSTFQDITHPGDLDADLELLKDTLEGRRNSYMMFKRYLHAEGHTIWTRLTVTLVRDSEGAPVHFISQIEDLSANRQLEAALIETKERLDMATRGSGIGIWDWDIERNELIWDEQMFTLYGQDPSNFTPSYDNWYAALHEDDRDRVAGELNAAMEETKEFDSEFCVVWPNGTVRHMRGMAALQYNDEGRTTRMVGTNWDITASVEQREELARLARSAEEANRAKSQFLANMSHEIRTPLNGIIGMTDLLFESPDVTKEQYELIDIIKNCGQDLLNLVNDILDFSKIEAGRMDLDIQTFNLKTLLAQISTLFAKRANTCGLEFHSEFEDSLPEHLLGDSFRLRQVLNNLLANAVKFTNEGSVELRVERKDAPKQEQFAHLRFSVKDSGIGIDQALMSKLFHEFSQVDSSTSRVYGGTGLGLAISKHLVELMGGQIGVESKKGHGSEFWFTLLLPYAENSDTAQTPPSPDTKQSLGENYEGTGYRVLYAEDNETNQYLANALFKDSALQLDFAKNGLEALEALQAKAYDLVLMDVQMPKMDGIEATRQIRAGKAGEANSNIPILAVTAHAHSEDRQACLTAGMNGYIAKPVSKTALFEQINAFLPTKVSMNKDTKAKSPEPQSAHPVFDRESFFERALGDVEIARQLAEHALQDIEEHRTSVIQAIESSDSDRLHFHAHSIKGVALLAECQQLAQCAQELDQLAKGHHISEARELTDHFNTCARSATEALEVFCKS